MPAWTKCWPPEEAVCVQAYMYVIVVIKPIHLRTFFGFNIIPENIRS